MKDRLHRKTNKFLFYDFVKITGIIPALLLFRPKVIYTNPETKRKLKGRVLLIANHNSFLDPVIIMTSIVRRRIIFLATEDLFKTRLGAWFFEHVHCIPVNKENFNMASFRQVSENLQSNRVVAIFPEGSVDTDASSIHPFKAGAVMIALKNKAPILPVFIPKKEGRKQFVIIGDMIDFGSDSDNERSLLQIKNCNELLLEKEIELENKYNELRGK